MSGALTSGSYCSANDSMHSMLYHSLSLLGTDTLVPQHAQHAVLLLMYSSNRPSAAFCMHTA